MRILTLAAVFASSLAAGQTPSGAAIARAQAAIAKEPGKADHHNSLALALARRARETADPAYYDRAAAALEESLKLSPGNFEARKLQAWVLLGKHEFAKALELATALNRETPDDALVYGLLTDAHAELGNYQQAEEAAQWMLNLGRAGVPGMMRAAYLREIFGDVEGALELMHSAYPRFPEHETEDRAWLLAHVAHLLLLQGKYEEAERAARTALQVFPDYHYALAELAKAKSGLGAPADAVELLRKRSRLAPHPENLFDLAAALHRAGRLAEARRLFGEFEAKARAEMTSWDNANRELIWYYADFARRPADALKVAALEIARRRDVQTRQAYAWALHRNGRNQEARREIEAVLAVGTRDARTLYRAGAILLACGDSAGGRRLLRDSCALDPRSEVAARARRLLDPGSRPAVASSRAGS